MNPELNDSDTIDQLKDLLVYCRHQLKPYREAKDQQKWMTADILEKMERRRLAKSNDDEYSKLDAEIRRCFVCCSVMIVVKFLTCKIHNTDTDI